MDLDALARVLARRTAPADHAPDPAAEIEPQGDPEAPAPGAPVGDLSPGQEAQAERAAILEHEGGMDRDAAELRAAAGEDWPEIEGDPSKRAALRALLDTAATRERGEVPTHYTKPVRCVWCGPVWLWANAPNQVFGCPWCHNRGRGLPIPRPPAEDVASG